MQSVMSGEHRTQFAAASVLPAADSVPALGQAGHSHTTWAPAVNLLKLLFGDFFK